MKFYAKFMHRTDEQKREYWRTVWADGLHEANQEAEKYMKKGYVLLKVVEAM